MVTKTSDSAKVQPGSVKFELFGDILKISRADSKSNTPIKKYEEFCISMTERPREDRILMYKFLCGLALTAHARRTSQEAPRKVIYDVKNELFLSIVNNFSNRKVLNFRLCVSPRFKVTEYCDSCQESNSSSGLDARDWKFCKKCKVDRSYYNVISAYHRFEQGSVALYLGQDLIDKVFPVKELKKVPMGKFKEELVFGRYHFSPKNLHTIRLDSLLAVSEKLLKIAPATLDVDPDKAKKARVAQSERRPSRGAPKSGKTGQMGFKGPGTRSKNGSPSGATSASRTRKHG